MENQLDSIDDLDVGAALGLVGALIDTSFDANNPPGVHNALALAERLRRRGLDPAHDALLWYFVGNAWASLRHMRTAATTAIWEWEQPEVREEVIAFRTAFSSDGFRLMHETHRCQVHTNLGSLFSTVGRFIDAVDSFDRALSEDARFGMALGNKALGLVSYARALYDIGHRQVFAGIARRLVEEALTLPLETEAARVGFRQLHDDLVRVTEGHDCAEPEHLHGHSLGEGEEAAFRSWALRERLFLNPLNDLGQFAIAARDILHLPTMTVSRETGTGFQGFYNQLKQEFATARWLLFEGLQRPERHVSDRDLVLLDTLDETAFGFSLEKVKLAFRSAYSLLDKIAVFLATYFQFNAEMRSVNFRTVWYTTGHPNAGLWPVLMGRENWPLRGLFWLAKDLHESDSDYHAAILPEARESATLRNRLEHRYVKVVNDAQLWTPRPSPGEVPPDPFAFRIGRTRMDAKALIMLKTARAALIHLSLAIHAEERVKQPPDENLVQRGELPRLT